MQEYLRRSRFAAAMDGLGFHFLALALSLGWFLMLWGLSLPVFPAGLSLYALVLLIRRKTRDDRLNRREKRLREQLGGEMALEEMLLRPPAQAQFEAAVLLSVGRPLELLRTGDEGVICRLRGEKLLLSFLQLSPASCVTSDHVLSLQRSARASGAVRAVLCAPCAVSRQAREQARGLLPVTILSRETLLGLLGRAHPAQDRDLVALGKRRREKRAPRILPLVLDRHRAKKYAWYGSLLLGMYLFTRLLIYALPGLLCVFLAAACRCCRFRETDL